MVIPLTDAHLLDFSVFFFYILLCLFTVFIILCINHFKFDFISLMFCLFDVFQMTYYYILFNFCFDLVVPCYHLAVKLSCEKSIKHSLTDG